MLQQATAQRLHDSAQCWQWSISCLQHSSAHLPQISAHSKLIARKCVSPLAIAFAV